ncbi:hypothetical protein B0H21DRAFT_535360 [Amylocystis lapponica]|nr:hypothetical protein B0H21DRAFT_535360 [Amylocystis lapponica]
MSTEARTETFRLIRPFTPELAPLAVPFAVFLLALPVIACLSASAGWLVWRGVAVGWESRLLLQYGDDGSPYAEMLLPPLVVQQPYDVSIHLVVPATEANFALGNFMTSLTLSTMSNKTLASVRIPAIVLPPSSSPLSFLYNRPGTVDLNIPLLTSFVADTSRAIARVELGRRDQWRNIGNGQGRELSVLSALLRGIAVRQGVQGLIGRFPLFFALTAAGTFFFISFIVLAACLLPALEWRFRDNNVPAGDGASDKPRRRPRRRPSAGEKSPTRLKMPKRSRGATERRSSQILRGKEYEEDVKLEDMPQEGVRLEDEFEGRRAQRGRRACHIPLPSSASTSSPVSLRRRRSRLSQHYSTSDADE